MIVLCSLGIVFGIKNLIFETQKRVYNKKLLIANGLHNINLELVMGLVYTIGFFVFCATLFLREVELWFVLFGFMMGVVGLEYLIKGLKSGIREDGIYTNKGFYNWEEINVYEFTEVKNAGTFFNKFSDYISLALYIEGRQPDKTLINIAVCDLEDTREYFRKVGLRGIKTNFDITYMGEYRE